MSDQSSSVRDPKRAHVERRDFGSAEPLPRVVALAVVIGGASALAAWLLPHLIRLFTNLFFFQALRGAVHERFFALPLAAAKTRFRALTGAAPPDREDR